MDPLTLALIFGGAGLLKSTAVDMPKEQRQRTLAASTQRLNPWTGLKADPIQEADPLGSALQFGLTGAQVGMGMETHDLNKQLTEKALRSGGAPQVVLGSSNATPSLMPNLRGPNPFGVNPYSAYGY